jgi:sialate O-acetylesterase
MSLPPLTHERVRWRVACVLLSIAIQAITISSAAEETARPFVSPMFGDHMVLQRGKPNRIWGWTQAGAEVRVTVDGNGGTGTAAADGRWEVTFEPPPVGGPYVLVLDGPQRVEFTDVLVGDVWLGGGQSNMAFGLAGVENAEAEIKRANQPQIRLYRVDQRVSYDPEPLPVGQWRVCEPQAFSRAAGGFSAVAYFFGEKLHQELNIPIGLIQAAVGGSPVESWMAPATLRAFPEFAPAIAEISRLEAAGAPETGSFLMHWLDEYDAGAAGDTWAAPGFDDSDWAEVPVPGAFGALGVPDTPAVIWLRREIELPDPLPAGTARIQLGVVEKMDTTYLNGQWVGASSWVENPRNYRIRDGVLQPGRNLVALRVFKLRPDGGFRSPAEGLRLVLGDETVIPLAGTWKGKLSVDARPPHPLPLGFENYPTMPVVLYQGMIEPVAPLALSGFLWYQGEANFTRAWQYRALLPAMIADWRELFGQGPLPCYIVGLPAFMERKVEPADDGWAELRDAQAYAARVTPHTGLVTTVDTGDAEDIHPRNKRPVGERLALLALHDAYGRGVVARGPTFARLERVDGALRIHFDHTDGGLVVHGEAPGEFAIAGADRQWHRADARLQGDTVVVSSPEVPAPVAVRYAWQANPVATLFNGAGLPAVPFRTDDWPLSTQPVE